MRHKPHPCWITNVGADFDLTPWVETAERMGISAWVGLPYHEYDDAQYCPMRGFYMKPARVKNLKHFWRQIP